MRSLLRSLWTKWPAWRRQPERPKRPYRRRPELEDLEDRTVPATFSFTNPGAIAIPSFGDVGVGAPYPSSIAVTGLVNQTVADVTVTLHGLSHTYPDDIDILLVGPSGTISVVLMSDCGGNPDVTDVTLTFDDAALAGLPDATQISSGTFRPTDIGVGDVFPPPAPSVAASATLAAFDGTNPNGTWNLYVLDDLAGLAGNLARGWTLNLTTTESYRNNLNHTIPTSGPASVYPSIVTTYDLQGQVVADVTVSLLNLNHTWPDDLDVLLVGPTGRSVVLMSDCGGGTDLVGTNLTFSDAAPGFLPDGTAIAGGTYRPTNFGAGDAFPAPAPPGPHGTTLSVFDGTDPYGTWCLYLLDDTGGSSGSLVSGWRLDITTTTGGSTAQNLEPADYDGDGRADLAVYRRSIGGTSSAGWYVLTSTSGFTGSIQRIWGATEDVPVPGGDYDGDGSADLTVFRPTTGGWFILTSSSGFTIPFIVSWGMEGDHPLANADFDGDNRADIAVWRPTTGGWYALLSSSGFATPLFLTWGQAGDVPLPRSDFDGDGRDDAGVFRPSNGGWFVLRSSSGFTTAQVSVWGAPGDIPLPACDFDGDGRSDMAVYRPTGSWFVLTSSSNFTIPLVRNWGIGGDVHLLGGDYDGDGRADMTIFRPSTGGWYVLTSTSNYTTSLSSVWGGTNDLVLPLGDFDGQGGTDMAVWRPRDGIWYVLTSGAANTFTVPLIVLWGAPGDMVV